MSTVRVTCPWTKLEGKIEHPKHIDTRVWPWLSMEAIRFRVVEAHLTNHRELFAEVDQTGALCGDLPEDYIEWWHDKIITLHPALVPLIEESYERRERHDGQQKEIKKRWLRKQAFLQEQCPECGSNRKHWKPLRSNHDRTPPQ
jgi:hypothetical protein